MAIKVIPKTLEIAAGSAAAAYEFKAELGNETKRVLGYYVLILQNGTIVPEACMVSFANSAQTIVDNVGLGHLVVNQSVGIKDRFFKEEPFDVDGYVQVRLKTPVVNPTPFVAQVMFLCETTK